MAGLVTFFPPPAGSVNQVGVANSDSVLKRRVIDFAELTAAKGSTLVAGDTARAIALNPGDYVKQVYFRQLVAGTASSTMNVGDTAVGATAWYNGYATDGAAQTFALGNGANATAGKMYAAADYLLLTLGATPPLVGKVEITAEVYQFGTSIVK